MTKDKFQAELLEKVKEGIKPSDLKKQSQKQPKKPISPSPIVQKDEGYSSDYSDLGKDIPLAPPLPNQSQNNFADQGYTSSYKEVYKDQKADSSKNNFAHGEKKLLDQISSLKKQLQVYQDFKEADLRIKEKYKQEIAQQKEIIAKYSQAETEAEKVLNQQKKTIKELQAKIEQQDKIITELKNTAKTTVNNKPEINESKETKTFLCAECNQAKPHSELSRVFGKFSFCLECSKKARHQAQTQKTKPQPQEFTCHLCNKPKTEIPVKMKLDSTLQEYLICLECKPLAKEFNEADLITDEL
jgi:hypothetical protein